MKATVLGGSGQVGQNFAAIAADRGMTVRSVWRRSPEVAPPGADRGVDIAIEPDVLAPGALERVCGDADVVLSAIGPRRTAPRNPWSRILSPTDLCASLARRLDAALGARTPPLLVVSAAGVGDSRPGLHWLLRLIFDHSNVGLGYADLADMERIFAATGRDCLVVQPTTLTNGASLRCEPTHRFGLLSSISRRAVASYMVDRALAGDVVGYQSVMVSRRGSAAGRPPPPGD